MRNFMTVLVALTALGRRLTALRHCYADDRSGAVMIYDAGLRYDGVSAKVRS
jgi:hypothetical protein